MFLDIVIPGASFDLTPDQAQVVFVAFFALVIFVAARAAPNGGGKQ